MAHAYKIQLTIEDSEYLQSLTCQRTIQAQVVDCAKMLLYKAQGMSNKGIADRLDVIINTIKLCLSKFKKDGITESYLTICVQVEKSKSRMMQLHGLLILLAKGLLIWVIPKNFGR